MRKSQNIQFRKDFNESRLTNTQLLQKYKFKDIRSLIQYAKDNRLVNKPKPFTKAERENLKGISKMMKNPFN